ncbi:hypothetical protein MTO96_035230 [Rhipicephalus appendiculatus]
MSGGQTVSQRCGALRWDHVSEARDQERQDDETGGSEAKRRPCTSQCETSAAIPDGGDTRGVGVPEDRNASVEIEGGCASGDSGDEAPA